MKSSSGIAVLGAGAWGTALAQLYAETGRVPLWSYRPEHAEAVARARENLDYLPGIPLHENVQPTHDMAAALSEAEVVLLVAPAQFAPEVAALAAPHLAPGARVLICSKGIHIGTQKLLPDVVAPVLPNHPIAVLSGPNLAHEVARGLPAAATIAAADEAIAFELAERLRTASFRPYAGTDMVGAALASALKNVLALAAGMVMGAGLGENARAALITRGMAEITRLGLAMGARLETFAGLSGLGDVMLTCHAMTSRNFSCGFQLGQGRALADILAERKAVTEGIHTVAPALALAARYGVELPICAAVAAVLEDKINVGAALAQLMARPLKGE